jgi:ferrous iron transport protein B
MVKEVQVKGVDSTTITKTDKVDRIVAHRFIGILIFAIIMFGVFSISQSWVGPIIVNVLDKGISYIATLIETGLDSIGTSDLLKGFIIEGLIGGFAAVVGFVPLIMVLFFLLNLLEDSGYMSRVALVMDRYFKKIGLAGKSIIPMYVGTACSIPAIMAARTIKNEKQRRMTVLLTPFVPCGAKLPVIALLLGVFFTNSSLLTGITYLLAIAVIFLAGYVIKSIIGADFKEQEDTFLVVELPNYKWPSLIRAFRVMLDSAWAFVKKAATIIVIMNAIVWLTTNFNFRFQVVEDPSNSMLRFISEPVAWLMIPLGLGFWGLASAAVAGFVAKEEVVGALAVIFAFSVSDELVADNLEMTRQALTTIGGLTTVSAFAFMAFNLFTPPCFAAIGAMNSELGSKKWIMFAILMQFAMGYFVALIIYQAGTLIFYQELGKAFIPGIVILVLMMGLFFYLKFLARQGKGLANIG